ncbi:MAG: putative oxidoreductase [Anaerolineales bacterium]|nr:putative oxidoreductase [Anaerolineales bacterium]
MATPRAEVVICGAGIAGISAAYHLAVKHRVGRVVLVDERPPLSLTSDKSTECYRNWWPGPGDAMVRLMNRSIDLLDGWARQSGNRFNLNRRGYLFATAEPERVQQFAAAGEEAASLGAGRLRRHGPSGGEAGYVPAPSSGFEGQPDGSDLITDPDLIRRHFPYLAPDTVAVIHPRRCGWFSAQQLGAFLLEEARASGAEVLQGRVAAVHTGGGRLRSVRVDGSGGSQVIETDRLVLAAGPLLPSAAAMLDLELPVFAEWHVKVDERLELAESEATRHLLDPFPAGVHARPEGPEDSPILLILWTYHTEPLAPVFPGPVDPMYPEVALRGLARMVPGLSAYVGRAPRPVVDGGYYLKTRENRPLIGPLPVHGAFVLGALSGYGLMASAGAGEILAAHVVGEEPPSYARAFLLERYDDPVYQALLENWGTTGQL